MFHHNKKRNPLVIETAVAGIIAEAILQGNDAKIESAKKLFLKHLGRGEMKKELTAAKTLFEGIVPTREAATSVLDKVKSYIKTVDVVKLDSEKTLFIHEAQRELPDVFQRKIDEYDSMVSIQLLLNHWTKGSINESILGLVAIEEQVIDRLVRKPKPQSENILEEPANKVEAVSTSLLEAKIDEAFGSLGSEQRQLLKAYTVGDTAGVTMMARNSSRRLLEKLERRSWDSGRTEEVQILQKELEQILAEGWVATEDHTAFLLSLPDLEKELGNK